MIVGTSSGDLTNVVMDGVASRNFDPTIPDDQLYSQDAYTSNLTFWFAINNGSIPYTQKQDFFGSGIDISAVGTGGASLVLDPTGSLYDTVATGLYVVFSLSTTYHTQTLTHTHTPGTKMPNPSISHSTMSARILDGPRSRFELT